MTAPAATGYRLIEKPSRVIAVDLNDVEICGARQPYGRMHQVLAMTRETAVAHVQMIAELFVAAHR